MFFAERDSFLLHHEENGKHNGANEQMLKKTIEIDITKENTKLTNVWNCYENALNFEVNFTKPNIFPEGIFTNTKINFSKYGKNGN